MTRLLCSIILLTFSTIVWSGDVKTIIVEGIGINADTAAKNAGQQAVRQVVGMYVISDVATENSKIIKNEILSTSNGYIKSFKIINQSQENGLFTVEAEVAVETAKVSKKVVELNLTTKKVTSTSLKVKLSDKFNAHTDFRTAFKKVVLEPVGKNQGVFEVSINSFNVLTQDEAKRARFLFKGQDGNKYRQGDLQPVILSFTSTINTDYLASVEKFFSKNSNKKEQSYNNAAYTFSTLNIDEDFKLNRLSNASYSVMETKDIRSYYLEKTKKNIVEAETNKFRSKYHGEFIVRLLDKNNNLLDTITLPVEENAHLDYRKTTISSSGFVTKLYNTKTSEMEWHATSCFVILGVECKNRKNYFSLNKDQEKGIVILLDKARAETIESANIEIKWYKI